MVIIKVVIFKAWYLKPISILRRNNLSQVARVKQQIDKKIAAIHLLHRSALVRRYAHMQAYYQERARSHQESLNRGGEVPTLEVVYEVGVEGKKGAL